MFGTYSSKFTRYRRLIPNSGGQYDIDDGITHAVEYGQTLCGRQVGPERRGWFRTDSLDVTCKVCLSRINGKGRD